VVTILEKDLGLEGVKRLWGPFESVGKSQKENLASAPTGNNPVFRRVTGCRCGGPNVNGGQANNSVGFLERKRIRDGSLGPDVHDP